MVISYKITPRNAILINGKIMLQHLYPWNFYMLEPILIFKIKYMCTYLQPQPPTEVWLIPLDGVWPDRSLVKVWGVSLIDRLHAVHDTPFSAP